MLLLLLLSVPSVAFATETLFFANDATYPINPNTLILNFDDSGGDTQLQFGAAVAEVLKWNTANGRFEFTDDLFIQNNLSASGALSIAGASNLQGAATFGSAVKVRANMSGSTLRVDKGADIWGNLGVSGTTILDGNVGVGITSPQARIHTKGTSNYGQWKLSPDAASGETSLGFFSDTAGTDTNDAWIIGQNGWSNTSDFVIGNENNGAGGNVRLLIEKSGNIGIGTTTPETKLEVTGTMSGQILHAQNEITSSGSLAVDGNAAMEGNIAINNDNGATDAVLTFGNTAGAETVKFLNDAHRFELSDDVHVTGALMGSGALSITGASDLQGAATFGSTITVNGVTYTFPASDGTASGKVLKTDSAGQLSWSTDIDTDTVGMDGSTAEGMFVNQGGDTMTGALLIRPLTAGEAALEVAGTASGRILSFGNRLTGSGNVMIRTATDSATAFQVLDQDGGNPVFNIDTTNERVGIGTAAPETTLEVTGTMSGQVLHAQNEITSSGSLAVDGNAAMEGNIAINNDNGATDAVLTFGNTAGAETVKFLNDAHRFELSDDVHVTGALMGSGALSITGASDLQGAATFGSTITVNGVTYTFPASDGTASGKVLKTDSAGQLSWSTDIDTDTVGMDGSTAEGMFVNQGGDTMTGALAIYKNAGTATGNTLVVDTKGLVYDATNKRVGIGMAGPLVPLDVSTTTNGIEVARFGTSAGGAGSVQGSAYVGFSPWSLNSYPHAWIGVTEDTVGSYQGALIFGTRGSESNVAPTEQVRITSAGKVGIGTATPETKLEVTGTMSGQALHTENLLTSSGALSVDGTAVFDGGLTFGNSIGDAITVNAGAWTFANDTNFALTGGLNGLSFDSTTLSIDAQNHRVGIGTASPGTKLEVVSGDQYVTKYFGSEASYAGFELIGTAAGTDPFVQYYNSYTGDLWTTKLEVPGDKFHIMHGNATAGNEVLTILNTGNVGIGTTAPQAKLEVAGTISGSLLKMGNATQSGSIIYSSGSTLQATAKGSSGQILTSQGTAAPLWMNPTSSLVWFLNGNLAVATSQGAIVTMPYGFTPTSVTLRATGAPTGAAVIVDLLEDGTTLFGTKPEIAASASTGGGNAVFSDTNIAAGSEVRLDITQVGSTFSGSGLTVLLNGTRKY